jgi:transcriptional regulator with XRE-family HTH domain
MSLKAVAAASGGEITSTTLSAYERGEHAITVVRLLRLADLYGVPLDELVDPGAEPGAMPVPEATGADVRLDLSKLRRASGPEAEVVARLVRAVEARRGRAADKSITLRREDLVTAAATLDRTVDSFIECLREAGVLRRRPGRPSGRL